MNVDPHAVGMDKEVEEKTLQAGEWVVIDTDYIYKEGRQKESQIIWPANSYSLGFKRRWQQERQGKVVEEYQKAVGDKSKEERTISYESSSWEEEK